MVNVKGSPVHIRLNQISSLVLVSQISKNDSVTLHFYLILPNKLDTILSKKPFNTKKELN